MWQAHPATIERFGCVTLGVRDFQAAATTYTDVLQAMHVDEGRDDDLGARYRTVQLGDCLLQLAEPLTPDSDLGRHVERWGNMIYGLQFQVRDVDATATWFADHGIRFTRPRPSSLVTDPQDTFGAPLVFRADAPSLTGAGTPADR
jgi:catechol 2,3-dioxygenase-like lactoylglutathione lyase family enzyme